MEDVTHEELAQRGVPLVKLKCSVDIPVALLKVRREPFTREPFLCPRAHRRAVTHAIHVFHRLVIVALVSQENSRRYKLSPGDLNQRSFPGPSIRSIPTASASSKCGFRAGRKPEGPGWRHTLAGMRLLRTSERHTEGGRLAASGKQKEPADLRGSRVGRLFSICVVSAGGYFAAAPVESLWKFE